MSNCFNRGNMKQILFILLNESIKFTNGHISLAVHFFPTTFMSIFIRNF